jgi:hypothetical protein
MWEVIYGGMIYQKAHGWVFSGKGGRAFPTRQECEAEGKGVTKKVGGMYRCERYIDEAPNNEWMKDGWEITSSIDDVPPNKIFRNQTACWDYLGPIQRKGWTCEHVKALSPDR